IDLTDIAEGRLSDKDGVVHAPKAEAGKVPAFVRAAMAGGDLDHGTIVLLDNLDRLTWKTSVTFKEQMLHHVGLIYRQLLRSVKMRIVDVADRMDASGVDPIDPLFLQPDGRYYEMEGNSVQAEALPSISFSVKD